MATKKKKKVHGGKRKGAGRPLGSGTGHGPNARINRIGLMMSNDEFAQLQKKADAAGEPVATLAHDIIARNLKRTK